MKTVCGELVLKIDEAAVYLSQSDLWIRKMVAVGALPTVKVGKIWMFRKTDLAKYLVLENKDPLYNVDEAAIYLGVPPKMVWRMVHDGRLDSVKVGKYRRIRLSALEKLLNDVEYSYEPPDVPVQPRKQPKRPA